MDLNAVLRRAVESGASDVHFKVGQPLDDSDAGRSDHGQLRRLN